MIDAERIEEIRQRAWFSVEDPAGFWKMIAGQTGPCEESIRKRQRAEEAFWMEQADRGVHSPADLSETGCWRLMGIRSGRLTEQDRRDADMEAELFLTFAMEAAQELGHVPGQVER